MKTIEVSICSFAELSPKAQQTAIDNYRGRGIDTSYNWDEAHKSVKAFHELFGTKSGHRSWLDFSTSNIDNNILELKGLRLRTYLVNNFGWKLWKGKYFSLWSKTEKSFKYHKEGFPVLKSRYSKVIKDNQCNLTGVCWDMDLLNPFYKFINDYREFPSADHQTFEDLIRYAFDDLKKTLESEDEYRSSDEAIREELENQDNEYTEDGEEVQPNPRIELRG